MFLPLGDAPQESTTRPWVNYGLIALNVLVYVWATAAYPGEAYNDWVLKWGFVPLTSKLGTIFTSMFMHANFMHLAGNMLYLWIFGDNVEGRLGHVGYLFAYLASGLAAVLLFRVLDPGSLIPLVGASGAIFGVLGFYFLAFPRNRVRIVYWFFIIGWAWLPARLVLGFYFVLNLFSTLSSWGDTGAGGVAYAAHVGGFVFGLGIAFAVRGTRQRAEVLERASGHGSGPASALLETAREALGRGDLAGAESALLTVVQKHVYQPEAAEGALQLGLLYVREGRPEAAREYLTFAARLHPDPRARAVAARRLQAAGCP